MNLKLCLMGVLFIVTFDSLAQNSYYWVGGDGNWSDINHWSTSSGGTERHLTIPGPDDNVIFDANSFSKNGQSVNVLSSAFCKDLDFRQIVHNVNFKGSSELYLYGSLLLSTNLEYEHSGTLFFEGSSSNIVVNTKNHELSDVSFQGGGTYSLIDSLICQSINLVQGKVVTNGNVVFTRSILALDNLTKTMDIGRSQIKADTIKISGENTSFLQSGSTLECQWLSAFEGVNLGTVKYGGDSLGLNNATVDNLIFSGSSKVRFYGNGNQLSHCFVAWYDDYSNFHLGGSNSFDTLIIKAINNYFYEGTTTQVNDYFELISDGCIRKLNWMGGYPNNMSRTIVKVDGDVLVENAQIFNIEAQGSTELKVKNSIDFGGNIGLSFISDTHSERTLFWVGNGGDWHDDGHWSLSSGGMGGECPPEFNDDVVFDENSFDQSDQSIEVMWSEVDIRNFDVRNVQHSPRFNVYGSFTVSGSLHMAQNMEWNGSVKFNSKYTNNVIQTSNHQFEHVEFSSDSLGGWGLQDTLKANSIAFHSGTFKSNGNTLVSGSFFASAYDNTLALELGSSYIYSTNFNLDQGYNSLSSMDFDSTQIYSMYYHVNKDSLDFNVVHMLNPTSEKEPVVFYSDSNFYKAVIFHNPVDELNLSGGYYQNMKFKKSVKRFFLYDINEFDTLIFSPGSSYNFYSSNELKINKELGGLQASCESIISLLAEPGNSIEIVKNTGHIDANYLILKNIKVSGGAVFNAHSSVDSGGNNGWNFIDTLGSRDLFWVGGTGDWYDSEHWSLSSGGIEGECPPNIYDNVTFDENSFLAASDTVKFDSSIACADMLWSSVAGAPSLIGSDDLSIFGSLTLDEALDSIGVEKIYFSGNGKSEIFSAGKAFNNVYFTGEGEYNLLDDFTFSHLEIRGANSHFKTNSNNLIGQSAYITYQAESAVIDIKGSVVELNSWNRDNYNSTLLADDSHFIITSFFYDYSYEDENLNKITFKESQNSESMGYFSAYLINKEVNEIEAWNPGNVEGLGNLIKKGVFHKNATLTRNNSYDTLMLSSGHEYNLSGYKDSLRVNHLLQLKGNCNEVSVIRSEMGDSVLYSKSAKIDISYVTFRNISAYGGAEFVAYNSFDDYSNEGWTFESGGEPRTLYWVNGNGSWNDQDHWSLSSGGLGGACIPTSSDKVIVDTSSFVSSSDSIVVQHDVSAVVKDLVWNTGDIGGGLLLWTPLTVYGDFILNNPIAFNANGYGLQFRGSTDQKLWSAGNNLQNIDKSGDGALLVEDDLEANSLEIYSGGLDLKTDLIINSIKFYDDDDFIVKLNNSTVVVDRWFWQAAAGSELKSGSSILQINSYFGGGSNLSYNDIEYYGSKEGFLVNGSDFGDVNFYGNVSLDGSNKFGNVRFHDNAEIKQSNEYQKLAFTSERTYTLGSGKVQNVSNDLVLKGNNCAFVTIKASETGSATYLEKPSDTVAGNFLNLRDIHTKGGAVFYAGDFSNNLGGNNGWIYTKAPNEVSTGFGEDRVMCRGYQYELIPEGFNAGANASYLWDDGSTDYIRAVDTVGTYSVIVSFASGCFLADDVNITDQVPHTVELPEDEVLCPGDTKTLESSVLNEPDKYNLITYLWQDESTSEDYLATSHGLYYVDVSIDACTIRDSVYMLAPIAPSFSLGNDTTVCETENIMLEALVPEATYLWQDGSMLSTYNAQTPGVYYVEVTECGTTYSDTLVVKHDTIPKFQLGNDRTLCQGQELEIEIPHDSITHFLWNDGSIESSRLINNSGQYVLSADRGMCQFSDTINVRFDPFFEFSLGKDTTLCEGQILVLRPEVMDADSFLWHDKSDESFIEVSNSGGYYVEVHRGGCIYSDTIQVNFDPLFEIDLGRDTTLCEGQEFWIEIPHDDNTNFRWNNGNTASSRLITTSGQYILFADRGMCQLSDTIDVQFDPVFEFSLGKDTTLCEGQVLVLKPEVKDADSFLWHDSSDQPSIEVSKSGEYYVEISRGSCLYSDTIKVEFDPLFEIDIGNDTTLCEGQEILLELSGDHEATYLWNDGSNGSNLLVDSEGVYTVQGIKGACRVIDSVDVQYHIFDLPKLLEEYRCEGYPASLESPLPLAENHWSTGVSGPSVEVDTFEEFYVAIEENGCRDTVEYVVKEKQRPVFVLEWDTLACLQDGLVLKVPLIDRATYLWNTGEVTPSITPQYTGYYEVNVEFENCGNFSNSVDLVLEDCALEKPIILSPNNDGINDSWRLTNFEMKNGISFQVYNKQGHKVYEDYDFKNSWNGQSSDGGILPIGTYFYTITHRELRTISGQINIVL